MEAAERDTDVRVEIPAASLSERMNRPLLQELKPFSPKELALERRYTEEVAQEMGSLWENECAKYEESISVSINNTLRKVPRRNYANTRGEVQDPTLYPYDTSCYPLLDAYDHLYSAGHRQPIEDLAVLPCTVPLELREDALERGDFTLQGYMPASLHSIVETLVQQGTVNWPVLEEFPYLIRLFEQSISHSSFYMSGRLSSEFWNPTALQDIEPAIAGDPKRQKCYGPAFLPRNRQERSTILLNILRHSMSELQRDHTLSTAVMLRLMRHHDFDDVHVMRKLLAIMRSEFVQCEDPYVENDEQVDHFCPTWQLFVSRFQYALAIGITYMTREHAVAIASFVRVTYCREFLKRGPIASGDIEEKRKILLKRNLMNLRAEDDAETFDTAGGNSVPGDLIAHIVEALGMHAATARRQLVASQKDSSITDDNLAKTLDSYLNSVQTLVGIAEATFQSLPSISRFYSIASSLVSSLCLGLVDTGDTVLGDEEQLAGLIQSRHRTGYLAHTLNNLFDSRLTMPRRFCVGITQATAQFHGRPKKGLPADDSERGQLLHAVDVALHGRPSDDVRDAVRGLFLRELVDIRSSGVGYGDFLLWCRFEVTPLDPILFWKHFLFPCEEDDSDEEDDEEDADAVNWDVDEEDYLLDGEELEARVDLTLLALVRTWDAPWTPESHMSYQPQFRKAVCTLALCTHRLGIPNELVHRISAFMHRDWWCDERNTCFDFECRVEMAGRDLLKSYAARQSQPITAGVTIPRACVLCPSCGVSRYCSQEHRERDHKSEHKSVCGKAPYCAPTKEETNLFAALFGGGSDIGTAQGSDAVTVRVDAIDGDEVVVEEDDDDDWESIDSDEVEEPEDTAVQRTKTQLIHQFFKREVYNKRNY